MSVMILSSLHRGRKVSVLVKAGKVVSVDGYCPSHFPRSISTQVTHRQNRRQVDIPIVMSVAGVPERMERYS